MSVCQREFLFLMSLTAAAAMAGFGQTEASEIGSARSDPLSASIPDFSGIWAHPYLPGFEPPASGPGPILNRSRSPNGRSNFNQLVGDFTNPILRPEAAEIVQRHGEMSWAGLGYPTPSNQCWPGGVPYIFWDYLLQMFQQPDKITMIYRHGNEVRRVRLNQPHPVRVTPSWYGDSVGHYEEDTLVIDTVGVKIGPYAMVDMYGTPYTQALHVVERYRLLDHEAVKDALERGAKENQQGAGAIDRDYEGKFLQIHLTIEDKGAFTTPWTATVTYARDAREWPEIACAENIHEYYYNKNSEVPHADRPDF
jgi:hemerythrin-like domain-containing protein